MEEQWEILQPGHHEGYVSWQEWLEVQEQLAQNHPCREGGRGPAREGPALLQGLVVCGHCGYGMGVSYNGKGWAYACTARDPASRRRRACFSAGGKRIDREVVRLFLEQAAPAGAEAAIEAAAEAAGRAEAGLRRWEQALEHCRYEARLAERRYRQVDPDNRLVAATLEREWELAEVALKEAEQALAAARAEQREPPPATYFAELGANLARVWDALTTSNADRKRLLGCLVEQVTIENREEARQIAVSVHWQGGLVHEFELPKLVHVPQPKRTDASTLEMIRNLSAHYNDRTLARLLNQQGRRTARDLPFTTKLVGGLRRSHGIPAHQPTQDPGAAACIPLGVADAARELRVNEATLYRWIHAGLVPVLDPGVERAPLRVKMTAELRARFRPEVPEGFVPVASAMRRLGVTRQTIWNRIKAGQLASCHVTHGGQRGLYVRLPEDAPLPLFETLTPTEQG